MNKIHYLFHYLFAILSIVLIERIEGADLNHRLSRQNYRQEKAENKNIAKINKDTATPIIIGDEEFTKKTKSVLSLIKVKAPYFYKLVIKYISIVKSAEKSAMEAWANSPTLEVDEKTDHLSLSWYASCIVHEAQHSKIYNDYLKKINDLLPVKYGLEEKLRILACLPKRNF